MLKNDELSNSEKNEYLEIIIDESERLAMAKRICSLHNGDIIIKSTGPTGTVFEITLPCDMK